MATRTNLYLDEEFLSAVTVLGGKPLDEMDRDDLMMVLHQFYINMECSDEARNKNFQENDKLRCENDELRCENDKLRWENYELRGEIRVYHESLRCPQSPKTAQSPPPPPPPSPSSQYAQNAAALSGQTVKQNEKAAEKLLSLHRSHYAY